jgi:hypothetical protein
MNIQSIQKTTVLIVLATLTALYEGLARYGCGVAGLPYYEDDL